MTFTLRPGTVTALVGESGSGKSTVARMLARLYEPTSGSIYFKGEDVTNVKRRRDVLRYRSQVQMIFQDPFGSLNPVKTIRHHLARPLKIHGLVERGADRRAHRRAADDGRAGAAGALRRQVSVRALGRPASARRDRPRARRRADRARGRRADLDARRLDPRRHPQPDARPEGARAARVPLRHARSRERPLHRRLHARHVRRPDRRARARSTASSRARCTRTRSC